MLEKGDWNISFVETKRTKRGVYFKPSPQIQNLLDEAENKHRPTEKPLNSTKSVTENLPKESLLELYSTSAYEELGHSLATVTIGGSPYLAIGSPNYGVPGSPQLGRVLMVKVDNLSVYNGG